MENTESIIPTVDNLNPLYIGQALERFGGGFQHNAAKTLFAADLNHRVAVMEMLRHPNVIEGTNNTIRVWWELEGKHKDPTDLFI